MNPAVETYAARVAAIRSHFGRNPGPDAPSIFEPLPDLSAPAPRPPESRGDVMFLHMPDRPCRTCGCVWFYRRMGSGRKPTRSCRDCGVRRTRAAKERRRSA